MQNSKVWTRLDMKKVDAARELIKEAEDEVSINCRRCGGQGCQQCNGEGWEDVSYYFLPAVSDRYRIDYWQARALVAEFALEEMISERREEGCV